MKKLKQITIYGKENCPYCERAKMLTKKIQENQEVSLEYHDIVKENISKEEVTEQVKAPTLIATVPQITLTFADSSKEYVGGFDNFYDYVTKTDWI